MEGLGSFLEKAKKFLSSDAASKKDICDAVKNVLGEDLSRNSISVSGGVARINTHPLIKGEILMKKEEILSEVLKLNPNSSVNNLA